MSEDIEPTSKPADAGAENPSDSPPEATVEPLHEDSQADSVDGFRLAVSEMSGEGSEVSEQPSIVFDDGGLSETEHEPTAVETAVRQLEENQTDPENVRENLKTLLDESRNGNPDATKALTRVLLAASGEEAVLAWKAQGHGSQGSFPDLATLREQNPELVTEVRETLAGELETVEPGAIGRPEAAALVLSAIAARRDGNETLHSDIAAALTGSFTAGEQDMLTRQGITDGFGQFRPNSEFLADSYLEGAKLAELRRDFPLFTRLGYDADRTGLTVLSTASGSRKDLDLSDRAALVLKTVAEDPAQSQAVTDMLLRAYSKTGDSNRLLSTLGAIYQDRSEIPDSVHQTLHHGVTTAEHGTGRGRFQYESALTGMMQVSPAWTDRDIRLLSSQARPEVSAALRVNEAAIPTDMQERLLTDVRPLANLNVDVPFNQRKHALDTMSALAASATSADVQVLASYGTDGSGEDLLSGTSLPPDDRSQLRLDAAGALLNISQRALDGKVARQAETALVTRSWGENLPNSVRDELARYAGGEPESLDLSSEATSRAYAEHVRPPLAEVFKRTGLEATDEEFERASRMAIDNMGSEERVRQILRQVDMLNALPPNLREEITGSEDPVNPQEVVGQMVAGSLAESDNKFLAEENVEDKIEQLREREKDNARDRNQELNSLNDQKAELTRSLADHTKDGVGFLDRAFFWQGNVEKFENRQVTLLRQIQEIERQIEEKTEQANTATGRAQALEMAQKTGEHSQLTMDGKQLDADKLAMEMWGQYGNVVPIAVARALVQPDANGKNAFQRLKEQGLAVSDTMPELPIGTDETFKSSLDALKNLPNEGDSQYFDVDAIRQNALRNLNTAPEFTELFEGSQALAKNLPVLQEMFVSGLQGTKYEEFVANARQRAGEIETAMKEMEPHVPAIKERIEEMKQAAQQMDDETAKKALLEQAEQLENSVKLFDPESEENKQFKHMIATIQSDNFDENTVANWFKKNGVVVAVTIAAAVAAVATAGAAAPLLGLAAAGWTTVGGLTTTLIIAGAGAAGGLIGGELAKDGLAAFNENVYDTGLGTGERSRLTEWRRGTDKVDLFTGERTERTFWGDVVKPYTRDFVIGTGITFATMGVGAALSKGINAGFTRLGQTRVGNLISNNVAQLDEIAERTRIVDRLMANNGQQTFSRRFVNEFGDECFDEIKETAAEDAIQKSLGQSNAILGFMATALVAGSKGVRFTSFNRGRGEIAFDADSEASVAALRQNLIDSGYQVADGAHGAMLVTGNEGVQLTLVNGRVVARQAPAESGADVEQSLANSPVETTTDEGTQLAEVTSSQPATDNAGDKRLPHVASDATNLINRMVETVSPTPALAEIGRSDGPEGGATSGDTDLSRGEVGIDASETQIAARQQIMPTLQADPSYNRFNEALTASLEQAFPDGSIDQQADFETLTQDLYLKFQAEGRVEEAGQILESVGKILSHQGTEVPLTQLERVGLAKQLLNETINARHIDQGTDFTCGPSVTQEMLLMAAPAQYAEAIASLVTTGKFSSDSPRPVKVDLTQDMLAHLPAQYHDVLRPDYQAGRSLTRAAEAGVLPRVDGERTYASQLGQLLAANIHTQNLAEGSRSVYVKGPPDARLGNHDTGERQFLISDQASFDVVLSDGSVKLGPGMQSTDLQPIFEAVTGRPLENDFVLVNTEQAIASGKGKAFRSAQQLNNALLSGNGPFVIEVDPRHRLFTRGQPAQFGADTDASTTTRPRRHVVLAEVVRDASGEPVIDQSTGTVMLNVYDQYGRGRDHVGDNAVSASTLFDATRQAEADRDSSSETELGSGGRRITQQKARDIIEDVMRLPRLDNRTFYKLQAVQTVLINTNTLPPPVENKILELESAVARGVDEQSLGRYVGALDSTVAAFEGPRLVEELSRRFLANDQPGEIERLRRLSDSKSLGPANVRLLQRLAQSNGFSRNELRTGMSYVADRVELQRLDQVLSESSNPYDATLTREQQSFVSTRIGSNLRTLPRGRGDRPWFSDLKTHAQEAANLRDAVHLLADPANQDVDPVAFAEVVESFVNRGVDLERSIERMNRSRAEAQRIARLNELLEQGIGEVSVDPATEAKYGEARNTHSLSGAEMELLASTDLSEDARKLVDGILTDPTSNTRLVHGLLAMSASDIDMLANNDYDIFLLEGMRNGWSPQIVSTFLNHQADQQTFLADSLLFPPDGSTTSATSAAQILSLSADQLAAIETSSHRTWLTTSLHQGQITASDYSSLTRLDEETQGYLIDWTKPGPGGAAAMIDVSQIGRVADRPALQEAILYEAVSPPQARALLEMSDATLDMVLTRPAEDLGLYSRYGSYTVASAVNSTPEVRSGLESMMSRPDMIPRELDIILTHYDGSTITEDDVLTLSVALDASNIQVLAELHRLPAEFRKAVIEEMVDPTESPLVTPLNTARTRAANATTEQEVRQIYADYIEMTVEPETQTDENADGSQADALGLVPPEIMALDDSIGAVWNRYRGTAAADFLADWARNPDHPPTTEEVKQFAHRNDEISRIDNYDFIGRIRELTTGEGALNPAEAIEVAAIGAMSGVSIDTAEGIYLELLERSEYDAFETLAVETQQQRRLQAFQEFARRNFPEDLASLDATKLGRIVWDLTEIERHTGVDAEQRMIELLNRSDLTFTHRELAHLIERSGRHVDSRPALSMALINRALASRNADVTDSDRLALARALATTLGASGPLPGRLDVETRTALIEMINEGYGDNISDRKYGRGVVALMGSDIELDVLNDQQIIAILPEAKHGSKALNDDLLRLMQSRELSTQELGAFMQASTDARPDIRAALAMKAIDVTDLSELDTDGRIAFASGLMAVSRSTNGTLQPYLVDANTRMLIEQGAQNGLIKDEALAQRLLNGELTKKSIDEAKEAGLIDPDLASRLQSVRKHASTRILQTMEQALEPPLDVDIHVLQTMAKGLEDSLTALDTTSQIDSWIRLRIDELSQGIDTSRARNSKERMAMIISHKIDNLDDVLAADRPAEIKGILSSIDTDALVYLDQAKVEWIAQQYRAQLETKLDKDGPAVRNEVLANVDQIIDGRVGQSIPAEAAEALVQELRSLGLSSHEIELAVAKLEQRRSYLSVTGLSEQFDSLAQELSTQGRYFHFVRPKPSGYASMGPEINVLVLGSGTPGTQLAYNFFKDKEHHFKLHTMHADPNNPERMLVTIPSGKSFVTYEMARGADGPVMYEVEYDRESDRWNRASEQPVRVPNMVLLDNPNSSGLTDQSADAVREQLTALQATDSIYVPEGITGSLSDGISPQQTTGFAGDINLFDIGAMMSADPSGATVNTEGVTRLARKLVSSVRYEHPATASDTEGTLDDAALLERIGNAMTTKEQALTEARLYSHLLSRGMTRNKLRSQMELWANMVDYRTVGDIMRFSRTLQSEISQSLANRGRTLEDAFFIIPPNSGSEHFIHEAYRQATGTEQSQFLTVEQARRMARRGELAGKELVLLDDNFDFGADTMIKINEVHEIAEIQREQAVQNILSSVESGDITAEQARSALESERVSGMVVANLFSFDTQEQRDQKLDEWRDSKGLDPDERIPPELRVETVRAVQTVDMMTKVDGQRFVGISEADLRTPQFVGKRRGSSESDTESNGDVDPLEASARQGSTNTTGATEMWPHLQPNNVSRALFEFAQILGHYPTRVQESYDLYMPLVYSLPGYMRATAFNPDLSAVEKATVLASSINEQIASQKRQLPGERRWNSGHLRAAQAYAHELERTLQTGDSARLESLVAIADSSYGQVVDPAHRVAVSELKASVMERRLMDFSSVERTHNRHRLEYNFFQGSARAPVEIEGQLYEFQTLSVEPETEADNAPFVVRLTYTNEDGETITETLGDPEATLLNRMRDVMSDAGIKGAQVANPHANGQMIAAYMARLGDASSNRQIDSAALQDVATELNQTLRSKQPLELSMMKRAHRRFELDYQLDGNPVTLDAFGTEVNITGLTMTWQTRGGVGKINFEGHTTDGQAIDRSLSDKIQQRLEADLLARESYMKGLYNGTNKAGKAHILASYLDRLAALDTIQPDMEMVGDDMSTIDSEEVASAGEIGAGFDASQVDWSRAVRLESGEHTITSGIYEVSGDARVTVGGDAIVRVADNAIVDATGLVTVVASGNAEVRAGDNVEVTASGNARVHARDRAKVYADENARVTAEGRTTIQATESARVYAREHAEVEANGEAYVHADGNASVTAEENASVVAGGDAEVSARDQANVVASGKSRIGARDRSSVEISGEAQLLAWGEATVRASGSAVITIAGQVQATAIDDVTASASKNSSISASGNASVRAKEDAFVEARDSVSVVAQDTTTIHAFDNSTVSAWSISRVVARDNVQIVGNDASNVELHDNAHAEVTSLAHVVSHGDSTFTVGGASQVEIPQLNPLGEKLDSTYPESAPVIQIMRDSKGAITQIITPRATADSPNAGGTGTGFFTTFDGQLATAYHVVEGATGDIQIVHSNGRRYTARIVAVDLESDSALLESEPDMPSPESIVEFADDAGDLAGVDIVVLGHADGERRITASPGQVRGTRTLNEFSDAADKPNPGENPDLEKLDLTSQTHTGNSGSPVFRLSDGKVVGMATRGGSQSYRTLATRLDDLRRMIASQNPDRLYQVAESTPADLERRAPDGPMPEHTSADMDTTPSRHDLETGALSFDGHVHPESRRTKVYPGEIVTDDGRTIDVVYHSPEHTVEEQQKRLGNEQAGHKLSGLLAIGEGYPASVARTAEIDGQTIEGWLQESAGSSEALMADLKNKIKERFGRLDRFDEDLPALLAEDAELRSKLETAIVERIVFGDYDINFHNMGVSTDGTIRNLDLGHAFNDNQEPELTSYRQGLLNIGLHLSFAGQSISDPVRQKLLAFAKQYEHLGVQAELARDLNLTVEQVTAIVNRARVMAETGRLPEANPRMVDPENIEFFRAAASLDAEKED